MTLTLTERGQVTFRKDLLQHLGVKPGDRIDIDKMPDGTLVIRPARRTGSIRDVYGILAGKSKIKLTIEEINDAIADGWAGKVR